MCPTAPSLILAKSVSAVGGFHRRHMERGLNRRQPPSEFHAGAPNAGDQLRSKLAAKLR